MSISQGWLRCMLDARLKRIFLVCQQKLSVCIIGSGSGMAVTLQWILSMLADDVNPGPLDTHFICERQTDG
ncbi:hypothetical protein [Methylobacillus sp.]|uniref:hypothetical protein n=1 Tax=Methylobacillus sp. TaxID=56818 RepID=UPI002FE16C36